MRVEEVFESTYHREPKMSFCPYRVCPLGAHIDHQFGKINGFALDHGIHMAYGVKENGVIELQSLNFEKRAQFHIFDVPAVKVGDWADYLRGVTRILGDKYKLSKGLCGVIKGSLPVGGLSSSAALTICFLQALCDVNNISLTDREYIYMAKQAENEYVLVNCGKLDQSCEVLCKKDSLLYLDCLDDSFSIIPSAPSVPDFKIGIFFSGVEHNLANSAYNSRVDECKASAFALYSYALADHRSEVDPDGGMKFKDAFLRNIPKSLFDEYGSRLPSSWQRRCKHFYGEMQRVEEGVEYWKKGDLASYGRLVNESGQSSISLYESGSPELKRLYEIIIHCDGVYGGRFSGAGFKGCCMAFIDPSFEQSIREKVEKEFLESFSALRGKYNFHLCGTAKGVGG